MTDVDAYQEAALRTAAPYSDPEKAVLIHALGLAGEAGELAETVKKEIGHGHERSFWRIREELGDICWYIAVLAADYGIVLSEVLEVNIEKLRERYPDGFSVAASVNRVR